MKITPDTNLLVRSAVRDDPTQADLAAEMLLNASLVALSPAVLCEMVWVLRGTYGLSREEVAVVIRNLLSVDTVIVDRATVKAGLMMLATGGDFADGVIAHEGAQLGGEVFVSFDKGAVRRWKQQGYLVHLSE